MKDLQRFAGTVAHEPAPDAAQGVPLLDRFCPRFPLLIFGLFASSVITFVMTGLEETLPANVAVAFSL
jgi:magnesium transporter